MHDRMTLRFEISKGQRIKLYSIWCGSFCEPFYQPISTGTKHPAAFSTNHLADIDKTKHNYN